MRFSLGKGTYLLANPQGTDQNFERTIVLLCDHNEKGTFGLILNRTLNTTLSEALPEHPGTAGNTNKIFFGGPVEPGKLFSLHGGQKDASHPCDKICDGVYLVSNQDCLDNLLLHDTPETPYRFYLGCACWSAGQLEGEIKMNCWTVGQANANIVFYQNPDILWWYILRNISVYDPESPFEPSDPVLN